MYRKDNGVFAQLVLVLAGERETITNGDGVESMTPFTKRILRMLDLYRRTHGGTINNASS
jgi:hypothetical protein